MGWWLSKNVDLFLFFSDYSSSQLPIEYISQLDRISHSMNRLLQGYPSFRDSVLPFPWLTTFPQSSPVLDSRAFFPDGTKKFPPFPPPTLAWKHSTFFHRFLILLAGERMFMLSVVDMCPHMYIISLWLGCLCSTHNFFYGLMQCCTVIPELHAILKIFVIGTMDPYNFQLCTDM